MENDTISESIYSVIGRYQNDYNFALEVSYSCGFNNQPVIQPIIGS
jgi:hypothetical protein